MCGHEVRSRTNATVQISFPRRKWDSFFKNLSRKNAYFCSLSRNNQASMIICFAIEPLFSRPVGVVRSNLGTIFEYWCTTRPPGESMETRSYHRPREWKSIYKAKAMNRSKRYRIIEPGHRGKNHYWVKVHKS